MKGSQDLELFVPRSDGNLALLELPLDLAAGAKMCPSNRTQLL